MSRPYRVLGAFALVVGSLLAAATPAAAGTGVIGVDFTLPAVTRAAYSISGAVFADATSAVVPGVEVTATSTTASGPFTSGSGLTKATGIYTIGFLLPGSYTLRFDPPRTTNLQHGWRNASSPTNFTVSSPVAVAITTASRTGLNLRLPAGFRISGTVTRPDGTTAIPMVAVSAGGTAGSDATATDSAGKYTLMGLSPGSYQVAFGHDRALSNQTGCWYSAVTSKFSASCAAHTAVVIGASNVAGISPRIPNGLQITGLVETRAASPAPIVNAYVFAAGPEDGSAYTDATGRYTIAGLNPGSYKVLVGGPAGSRYLDGYYYATGPYYSVRATASASAFVISGAVTTLPIIKPATGFFITGKITNTSGTAVESVLVDSTGGAGTALVDPGSFTDVAGNYSIGPLPVNLAYKLEAIPAQSFDPSLQSGWYVNSPPTNFSTAASSALSIVMTADRVANMRLPVGGAISGTVTIAGSGVCGGCTVYAIDTAGTQVAQTFTTILGSYTLQGLQAGSYRVEAWASDPVVDATHVRIITAGFYKSGAAPNFSATLVGATAIVVTP